MSALPSEEKNVPTPAPTPSLHLRLVRQAVPAPQRVTGKSVAKVALELAMKVPLLEAITQAIVQLAEKGSMTPEQVTRIGGLSMKLIGEGLRVDDAISIALHEPPHMKPTVPIPEALKAHLFPPNLTGQNVMKLAFELNHTGTKMDDAIIHALRKFAAPRAVTPEQGQAVLEAAQQLFKEGRAIAEAFDIALKKTLPKHGH